MKVLLAHNYYRSSSPSGEDGVFRNEKELLKRNGVETIVYEVFNDEIDESTVKSRVQLALNTAWSRHTYNDISDLIRKHRPDIAHFHNTFPQISPSAYAACRDNSVPVVQTLHNFRFICPGGLLMRDGKPCEDCVGTTLVPALRYRCYRGSLAATSALVWMLSSNRWRGTYKNLVNRYICLTDFSASRLVAGGLPEDRIIVKPNFLPDPPALNSIKENYAVYVGRLTPEKGVRALVEAWCNIRELPLKIVGDGALRVELQDIANRSGAPIEFLGFRPRNEVMELTGRAALQIIPSECYEGFPLVVLEAFACGTPLAVSRIGSLDALIEDGVTGVKFQPGDPNDLAEVVRELWLDNEKRHGISTRARAVFDSNYTEERNFVALMDIYNAVRKECGYQE